MKTIFTVYGAVQPKQRPRARVICGHATIYTPTKTKEFEQAVAFAYKQAGGSYYREEPLVVTMCFKMPIPKSYSAVKAEAARCGIFFPTSGGDCDNLAKSVLDALNGVAFKDDKQVIDLHTCKEYADEIGVVVTLEEKLRLSYEEWKQNVYKGTQKRARA